MSVRTVALVTPTLNIGGAERHTALMAKTLHSQGHRTHVISVDGGHYLEELESAGVSCRVLGGGIGVRDVPRLTRELTAAVRGVSPDIVMVQNNQVDLPLRLGMRGEGAPLMVWKHTYGNTRKLEVREREIERTTGRWVSRYGAVCHSQVRYLTDRFGIPADRISVAPNTIPSQVGEQAALPPELEALSGRPVVLMVAALRVDKGHDDVLDAWPTVLEAVPDAVLVVLGGGDRHNHLARRVAKSGLTDSVRLLGQRRDVEAFLPHAQVLLLASWYVECFPYAGLEAMAWGVPIASTNVGGLPEMVDDGVTGALFPPHSPAALAGGVVQTLRDSLDRRRMGTMGRQRLEDVFAFNRWQQQIDSIMDSVIEQTGVQR